MNDCDDMGNEMDGKLLQVRKRRRNRAFLSFLVFLTHPNVAVSFAFLFCVAMFSEIIDQMFICKVNEEKGKGSGKGNNESAWNECGV